MRPGFFWFLCLDKSPAYKVKPDEIGFFSPCTLAWANFYSVGCGYGLRAWKSR